MGNALGPRACLASKLCSVRFRGSPPFLGSEPGHIPVSRTLPGWRLPIGGAPALAASGRRFAYLVANENHGVRLTVAAPISLRRWRRCAAGPYKSWRAGDTCNGTDRYRERRFAVRLGSRLWPITRCNPVRFWTLRPIVQRRSGDQLSLIS